MWTKLVKLPHSVLISSRANSIQKTHTKLHIKLHTKFNTSNTIPSIHNTNTPYQTQDQKPISNSRSKTHIKLKIKDSYQTPDQKPISNTGSKTLIKLIIKKSYQTQDQKPILKPRSIITKLMYHFQRSYETPSLHTFPWLRHCCIYIVAFILFHPLPDS